MHKFDQGVVFPKGVSPVNVALYGSRLMAEGAGIDRLFIGRDFHAFLVFGDGPDSWA